MITLKPRSPQPAAWQRILSQAITRPAELLKALDLPTDLLADAKAAAELFPLRVPRPYLQRITRGDPRDPLLLQVLPLRAEQQSLPGFSDDPVGDLNAMVKPGLLHKYHGRVLLVTTGACAVHCRYCFRRHFPYSAENSGTEAWHRAVQYIRSDHSISEVILSGGDPLSLSDERLQSLVAPMLTIPHLKRLRIHTRLPIVIPQRVDETFTAWLDAIPLQIVVVVHANHPQELNADVAQALGKLANSGALLLNQSVLLHRINDNAHTLAQLSEGLFDLGVLPYYLHLLDPVAGASHFALQQQSAIDIHRELAAILPGYLLPRLVTEQPGAASKLPLYGL